MQLAKWLKVFKDPTILIIKAYVKSCHIMEIYIPKAFSVTKETVQKMRDLPCHNNLHSILPLYSTNKNS